MFIVVFFGRRKRLWAFLTRRRSEGLGLNAFSGAVNILNSLALVFYAHWSMHFSLFYSLSYILYLFREALFDRFPGGILNPFDLLDHGLHISKGLLIINLHQPLDLFLFVEVIVIVLLFMQHTQYCRMHWQAVQLLLEVVLFRSVLLYIVVLDTDFVVLEKLFDCVLRRLVTGLQKHLRHEQFVGEFGSDTIFDWLATISVVCRKG